MTAHSSNNIAETGVGRLFLQVWSKVIEMIDMVVRLLSLPTFHLVVT